MKPTILILTALLLALIVPLHADLGLAREAYGVWDRGGFHTVADYPYARGQELDMSWGAVQTGRTGFDWSVLNAQLQFAEDQNQLFTCKVSPIDGSAPNKSMPSWMFGPLTANGGGVPSFSEIADPLQPTIVPASYVYGYYLNPQFQVYFEEMVKAFANHLRNEVSPNKQGRIAFVRVDTGATGDEAPYENGSLVPLQYQISPAQWLAYRLWVFKIYRKAFQEGPGPVIPLLFSGVEPVPGGANVEWNWILANVKGGFGIKHGGQLRGYQLSESESNVTVYKPLAVASDFKFFSRNEMDQTWTKPYFQLNVPLSMYWAALEQLNVGMSIWDWSGTCMEGASANGFGFTGEFFNKWAAELDPATAGGGFCVFHEGLDSSDTGKFPAGSGPGKYGNATWGNQARYTAICAAYAGQGAQMDDLAGATMGSVAQRNDNPGMIGFNDAGWKIHPGNYDRFITQLNPDTTSKGLWRINGRLTSSSHPYDRFARRSDHASGNDTMYFDINDNLLPSVGQRVQLNVTYLDRGTGQFSFIYDAVTGADKTAFTVNKTNTNTWMTQSIEVTDWCFGNHGANGSDLQLVNVASDNANPDTIFHGIEVIKLADVSVGLIGNGTVTGRNNTAVFSPLPSRVMESQRLELRATPAPGWVFTGWSGALTGTTPNPFLFPTKDTRLTATFALASVASSVDDFNSGTWTGGTGWSSDWTTSGAANAGAIAELNGGSASAQITRTLATPLTGATLSFDWDLDRIAANGSESGTVEVFNAAIAPSGAWQTVWTQNSRGTDGDGTANLVTSGAISLTGRITQVRFTLNANSAGDAFFIDNVAITGTPVLTPNTAPQFSSDPIGKTAATVGVAYSETLSGSASDPNSNPLTFSKLPGGPAWLSIAADGTLSGTPSPTDVGLNIWNVQVTSSGGSDTAILLIYVSAPGANPPTALSYSSNPATYTVGTTSADNAPTNSGGTVTRYAVSPALPNGLMLNFTTGFISGTPSVVTPTASYTVTATNSDGSATASVNITVNDVAPSALSYSSNPVTYVQGTAITINSPASSGGSVVSYAVSPALPPGLVLNSATGAISGTPSAVNPAASYTITATNSGGSATVSLSIAVVSAYAAWAAGFNIVQGPQGDDDGDGNSNYFEFIAGLDPTNASSVFTVKIAPVAGQPNRMAISFSPIVIGRTYTVKCSDSLSPGSWSALSGSISSDVGDRRTVIDTGATGSKRFYIVEISYP